MHLKIHIGQESIKDSKYTISCEPSCNAGSDLCQEAADGVWGDATLRMSQILWMGQKSWIHLTLFQRWGRLIFESIALIFTSRCVRHLNGEKQRGREGRQRRRRWRQHEEEEEEIVLERRSRMSERRNPGWRVIEKLGPHKDGWCFYYCCWWYVLSDRRSSWTQCGLCFCRVKNEEKTLNKKTGTVCLPEI